MTNNNNAKKNSLNDVHDNANHEVSDSVKTKLNSDLDKKHDEDHTVLSDDLLPDTVLIIPITDKPVFPGMLIPINVHNNDIIKVISNDIDIENDYVGVVLYEGEDDSYTNIESYSKVGVVCKILDRVNLPDTGMNVLLKTIRRFRLDKFVSVHPPVNVAKVSYPKEQGAKDDDIDVNALLTNIVEVANELSKEDQMMFEQVSLTTANIEDPGTLVDYMAYIFNSINDERQKILEEFDVKKRLKLLHNLLIERKKLHDVQKKLRESFDIDFEKKQKEYVLKEQISFLKSELGTDKDSVNSELKTLAKKLRKLKLTKKARKIVYKEFTKLKQFGHVSSEYHSIRNYLELITDLPWGIYTEEKHDIRYAEKVLNDDHFGLEDVKNRILEFIAVRILKKDVKGSIICLVGPPGVGKTSLGSSIAKALNRKFVKMSLGGMRDETEIKGHRRTYLGALPGRILYLLKVAKSSNPLFMLDEIDKIATSSAYGDPSSSLLEVLDPEQNNNFVDHYLDIPFDLSKVFFIATANRTDTIPRALLDRMEVIEISGYIDEEKYQIGKKYLLPKQLDKHGLKKNDIKLTKDNYLYIISKYARESGVRNFERMIERICRKVAYIKVRQMSGLGDKLPKTITNDIIREWLGPEIFDYEKVKRITKPGIVIGLAWTSLGGDTMIIESIALPSAKGGLKITGQIGDVMNESANIAYSYVKSVSKRHGVSPEFFDKNMIHIHVPEGATPKDGPSAGITMASAIMSLVKNKMCKKNIAMTGELTLSGNVLAIGGLKEKILASKRTGIKDVIIPKENKKTLEEIPDKVKKGLIFHYVDHVEDVFNLVLS